MESLDPPRAPSPTPPPRPDRAVGVSPGTFGKSKASGKPSPPPVPRVLSSERALPPLPPRPTIAGAAQEASAVSGAGADKKVVAPYPKDLDGLVASVAGRDRAIADNKTKFGSENEVLGLLHTLLCSPERQETIAVISKNRLDGGTLYAGQAERNSIEDLRKQVRAKFPPGTKLPWHDLSDEKTKVQLEILTLDLVAVLKRPIREMTLNDGKPYRQTFGHAEDNKGGWSCQEGTPSSESIKDPKSSLKEGLPHSVVDKTLLAAQFAASQGVVRHDGKVTALRSGRTTTPESLRNLLIYGAVSALEAAGGDAKKATGFRITPKGARFEPDLHSAMDLNFFLAGTGFKAKDEETVYLKAVKQSIDELFGDKLFIEESIADGRGGYSQVEIARPRFNEFTLSSTAQSPECLAGVLARASGMGDVKQFSEAHAKAFMSDNPHINGDGICNANGSVSKYRGPDGIEAGTTLKKDSAKLSFTDASYFDLADHFISKKFSDFQIPLKSRSGSLRAFAKNHWDKFSFDEKCSLMAMHVLLTGHHLTDKFEKGKAATDFEDDGLRQMLMARLGMVLNRAQFYQCMSGKDRTGAMTAAAVAMDGLAAASNPYDKLMPGLLLQKIRQDIVPGFTAAADAFIPDVITLGNGKPPSGKPVVKWNPRKAFGFGMHVPYKFLENLGKGLTKMTVGG
jgi:hypothetical protein